MYWFRSVQSHNFTKTNLSPPWTFRGCQLQIKPKGYTQIGTCLFVRKAEDLLLHSLSRKDQNRIEVTISKSKDQSMSLSLTEESQSLSGVWIACIWFSIAGIDVYNRLKRYRFNQLQMIRRNAKGLSFCSFFFYFLFCL